MPPDARAVLTDDLLDVGPWQVPDSVVRVLSYLDLVDPAMFVRSVHLG